MDPEMQAAIERLNNPVTQLILLLDDDDGDVTYADKLAVVSNYLLRAAEGAVSEQEHLTVRNCCFELLQEDDALIKARTWAAVNDMCIAYSQHGYLPMLLQPLYEYLLKGIFDKNSLVKNTVKRTLYSLLSHPELSAEEKRRMADEVIQSLSGHTSEQHHIEALSTIAEVCSEFQNDPMTIAAFTRVIARLAEDHVFRIRKGCAYPIAMMAQIMPRSDFESQLFPLYEALAQDDIWGVRKSCAESLGIVAQQVSASIRSTRLTAIFHRLATDESRWVRTAAYAVLGLFISTFVDIPTDSDCVIVDEAMIATYTAQVGAVPSSPGVEAAEDQRYNTHQYWKEPLPELDVDEMMALLGQVSLSMQAKPASNAQSPSETEVETKPAVEPAAPESSPIVEEEMSVEQLLLTTSGCLRLPNISERLVARPRCLGQPLDIPVSLLEAFQGMVSETAAKTVDADIGRHCAFSFPGVVWAVGEDGWHHLRATAVNLVGSEDWRVRSCLAASLHHVAQIIGPKLTEQDLLPHFDFFLSDWDEVRYNLIGHLADFLAVLPLATRRNYLPLFADLKQAEEATVWRNRHALATQLGSLCQLYIPQDVLQFLCPLGLELGADTVAAVRHAAAEAIGLLVAYLEQEPSLQAGFIEGLMMRFGDLQNSDDALMFLHVCKHVGKSNPVKTFEGHFLQTLLRLEEAEVVNVRLLLAATLTEQVQTGYWNDHPDSLQRIHTVLAHLGKDTDADISHQATGEYPTARVMLTGPAAGSIDRTTDSIYSASGLARALNQELANDSDDSSVDMVMSDEEGESAA
eukprot:m.134223 g.134223  ORF g.134223 m.134223 type:complete len:802 (-) comp15972_c0_seq1:831-3236(-)